MFRFKIAFLFPERLSSRLVLSVLLQILFISFAVGILSFIAGLRSKQFEANKFKQQGALTAFTSGLSSRLSAPIYINNLNATAIAQGDLDLNNFNQISDRFWSQLQQFPVSYINYGGTNGEFLGVQRLDNGQFLVNENTNKPQPGSLSIYKLGPHGKRGELIEIVQGMSQLHEEPWYTETVLSNRPMWSSIYQWEDDPNVFAISFNQPIKSRDGELLGVIGVDFVLAQLSTWMKTVWQPGNGLALIVDNNGYLVASSDSNLLFTRVGNQLKRRRIDQVSLQKVQTAVNTFFVKSTSVSNQLQPNFSALSSPPIPIASCSNQREILLDASPWGQELGLNWFLITFFESDLGFLSSSLFAIFALCAFFILAFFIWISLRSIISWLLLPLTSLRSQADGIAEALASNDLPIGEIKFFSDQPSEIHSMSVSIDKLIKAYNYQFRLLSEQTEREAIKDAQSIAILRDKLKTSLKAAAIAHEINQPLSAIILNSSILLRHAPNDPGLLLLNSQASEISAVVEKMRSLLASVQSRQEVINLQNLLNSIVVYANSNLPQLPALLKLNFDSERFWILADASQIQMALINLFKNSLVALQSCSVDLALIELGLFRQADYIVISISDNGPGFRDYHLDNLLLNSSGDSGLGLGLFLVQCTMENHNGFIKLGRSAFGGALVELCFPALPLPTSGYGPN